MVELDNCPECGEDMYLGDSLCNRCNQQEAIDNMTEDDFAEVEQHLLSSLLGAAPLSCTFSAFGTVEIIWTTSNPEKPVQYRTLGAHLVWCNEEKRLVPSEGYKDSPFLGEKFVGCKPRDVAKHINDWILDKTEAKKKKSK